ncbi:hypothetical protein BGZ46_002156 [Entomortierella lignicola]|nr:hypothetical protein BGZ46_002156 [Entomortierella lignicola]
MLSESKKHHHPLQEFHAIFKDDELGPVPYLKNPAKIETQYDPETEEFFILWSDVVTAFMYPVQAWNENELVPFLKDKSFNIIEPRRIAANLKVTLNVLVQPPGIDASIESLHLGPNYRLPHDIHLRKSSTTETLFSTSSSLKDDDSISIRSKRSPQDRTDSHEPYSSSRSPQYFPEPIEGKHGPHHESGRHHKDSYVYDNPSDSASIPSHYNPSQQNNRDQYYSHGNNSNNNAYGQQRDSFATPRHHNDSSASHSQNGNSFIVHQHSDETAGYSRPHIESTKDHRKYNDIVISKHEYSIGPSPLHYEDSDVFGQHKASHPASRQHNDDITDHGQLNESPTTYRDHNYHSIAHKNRNDGDGVYHQNDNAFIYPVQSQYSDSGKSNRQKNNRTESYERHSDIISSNGYDSDISSGYKRDSNRAHRQNHHHEATTAHIHHHDNATHHGHRHDNPIHHGYHSDNAVSYIHQHDTATPHRHRHDNNTSHRYGHGRDAVYERQNSDNISLSEYHRPSDGATTNAPHMEAGGIYGEHGSYDETPGKRIRPVTAPIPNIDPARHLINTATKPVQHRSIVTVLDHHDIGHQVNGYQVNEYQANGHQANGHQANGHQVNGHHGNNYHVNGLHDNSHHVNGYHDSTHHDNGHHIYALPTSARRSVASLGYKQSNESINVSRTTSGRHSAGIPGYTHSGENTNVWQHSDTSPGEHDNRHQHDVLTTSERDNEPIPILSQPYRTTFAQGQHNDITTMHSEAAMTSAQRYRKTSSLGQHRERVVATENHKDETNVHVYVQHNNNGPTGPNRREQERNENYSRGLGYYESSTPQDFVKALEYFLKAANQGHACAQYRLISISEVHQGAKLDYTELFERYSKAAEQDDADAQCILGYMCEHGYGVTQNHTLATYWYRRAADQGHGYGQCSLGCMREKLCNNSGYSEALTLYESSAKQDHARALNNLGDFYRLGTGVEKNSAKALEYYRRAAKLGYAFAQDNLGWMFKNSHGIDQDYKKALSWFQMAADQGLASAQYHVGQMHHHGMGIQRDEQMAIVWWTKASKQGHAKAKGKLEKYQHQNHPHNFNLIERINRMLHPHH